MNARKLPDGGILYDESDETDDDVEIEGEATPSPVPAIDWNEGAKNETGLRGAALIAEFVKRLPGRLTHDRRDERQRTCAVEELLPGRSYHRASEHIAAGVA